MYSYIVCGVKGTHEGRLKLAKAGFTVGKIIEYIGLQHDCAIYKVDLEHISISQDLANMLQLERI